MVKITIKHFHYEMMKARDKVGYWLERFMSIKVKFFIREKSMITNDVCGEDDNNNLFL